MKLKKMNMINLTKMNEDDTKKYEQVFKESFIDSHDSFGTCSKMGFPIISDFAYPKFDAYVELQSKIMPMELIRLHIIGASFSVFLASV